VAWWGFKISLLAVADLWVELPHAMLSLVAIHVVAVNRLTYIFIFLNKVAPTDQPTAQHLFIYFNINLTKLLLEI
jgi:hypothetical protein